MRNLARVGLVLALLRVSMDAHAEELRFVVQSSSEAEALSALDQRLLTTQVIGCPAPCRRRGLVASLREGGRLLVLVGPARLRITKRLPWAPLPSLTELLAAGHLQALSVFLSSMLLEAELYEPPPPPPPVRTSTVPAEPPPPEPPEPPPPPPPSPPPPVQTATVAVQPRPRVHLDAGGGLRMRTPALWGPELQLSVSAFDVRLGLALQFARTWSLEGRPIEVMGLGASLGYAPAVLELEVLSLQLWVGAALERLTIQRMDVESARRNVVWDAGPAGGAVLRFVLGYGLSLGLSVSGAWYPTGRTVEVPQGPSATLNRFGVSIAGQISWAL